MASRSATVEILIVAFLIAIVVAACGDDGDTAPEPPDPPTVTTGVVTQITATTAQGAGEVIDDGGADVTGRGLCWSTDPLPSLADDNVSGGDGVGIFGGKP